MQRVWRQTSKKVFEPWKIKGHCGKKLQETALKINTVGINHHELTGLPIVTASVVLQTNWGPIVGIFHEYAHLGKESSIHASGQLEWFHTQVNEYSKTVGTSGENIGERKIRRSNQTNSMTTEAAKKRHNHLPGGPRNMAAEEIAAHRSR